MTNDKTDPMLEALFEQAALDGPDADLMARVMADAETAQQEQVIRATRDRDPGSALRARRGWFAGLRDALGGWPGLTGVTAAGVVGLGLGLSAPDLMDATIDNHLWNLTGGADATPEIGALWTETGDV